MSSVTICSSFLSTSLDSLLSSESERGLLFQSRSVLSQSFSASSFIVFQSSWISFHRSSLRQRTKPTSEKSRTNSVLILSRIPLGCYVEKEISSLCLQPTENRAQAA